MATTEHNSATALPQQQRNLSPGKIDDIQEIHDRLTYIVDGLQGLGVAVTCDDLTPFAKESYGSAIFALGQYAQDLNGKLEAILLQSEQVKPQAVA
jgi:hypothetical protein